MVQCQLCTTQASFNYAGLPARFCRFHAKPDMVNRKNRTCIVPGCKDRPMYKRPGDLQKNYCKTHSTGEMTDEAHKFCKVCGLRASFCDKETRLSFYCSDHMKQHKGEILNFNKGKVVSNN